MNPSKTSPRCVSTTRVIGVAGLLIGACILFQFDAYGNPPNEGRCPPGVLNRAFGSLARATGRGFGALNKGIDGLATRLGSAKEITLDKTGVNWMFSQVGRGFQTIGGLFKKKPHSYDLNDVNSARAFYRDLDPGTALKEHPPHSPEQVVGFLEAVRERLAPRRETLMDQLVADQAFVDKLSTLFRPLLKVARKDRSLSDFQMRDMLAKIARFLHEPQVEQLRPGFDGWETHVESLVLSRLEFRHRIEDFLQSMKEAGLVHPSRIDPLRRTIAFARRNFWYSLFNLPSLYFWYPPFQLPDLKFFSGKKMPNWLLEKLQLDIDRHGVDEGFAMNRPAILEHYRRLGNAETIYDYIKSRYNLMMDKIVTVWIFMDIYTHWENIQNNLVNLYDKYWNDNEFAKERGREQVELAQQALREMVEPDEHILRRLVEAAKANQTIQDAIIKSYQDNPKNKPLSKEFLEWLEEFRRQ